MLNDKEKTINQVAGKDKADGDQHVDEITGIYLVKISSKHCIEFADYTFMIQPQ